jgi:RimJ/RimL family protein N-acetyltransferase
MSATTAPKVNLGPPPTFSIGEFSLRPFRPDDCVSWSAYLSDARTTAHTSWANTDVSTMQQIVARCIGEYSAGVSSRWALADAQDVMIGTCGLANWSLPHSHAELVYDLAPRYWRQGLMSKAVAAVLAWAFDAAGFNRIHAYVMDSNAPSQGLLERAGFQREGQLRQFRIARGKPRDFLLYARLHEEWLAAHLS